MTRSFQDWPSSADACRDVAARTGGIIALAFSCGKDSLGAWIQARRFFSDVRPFYRELIPGLAFVEEGLSRYERLFGVRILRVPGSNFFEWLEAGHFQEQPATVALVRRRWTSDVGVITRAAVVELGLDPDRAWIADGIRYTDSLGRAVWLKRNGPVDEKRLRLSAVSDWPDRRLHEELRRERIPLPADYALFGRSLDSIRMKFLLPIREHFPEDYRRIAEYFPLIEAEAFRYELMVKHGRAG